MNNEQYDLIVVGAGSGGNIAALAAAKQGFRTLLLEKHNITGGTGSSFRRGRFEFDTALHQLYGITNDYKGEKGHLRKVLEALDVYDKVDFITQKETFRLAMGDQLSVSVPGSYEGFKNLLKQISPAEADAIDAYQTLCDKAGEEFHKLVDFTAHNREISKEEFPVLFEYGSRMTKDLLEEFFKHPLVIGIYSTYYGYLGIPVEICPFFNLALCYERGQGTSYIKGGVAELSAAVTAEFEASKGTVLTGADVDQILVEDGQVQGVHLRDGRVFRAPIVISNISKIRTYEDLIDQKQIPEQVFADLRVSQPSQSIFVVYLGLDISAEESGIQDETSFCRNVSDPSIMFANRYDVNLRTDHLSSVEISCYNVDNPDASPEGTCIVSILASKNPDWFLICPPEEYTKRKDEYLEEVLNFLYQYYPKVKGHIEEIECATPVTLMRYLGSPNGSVYGVDAHWKDMIANKMEFDSPIRGFYFCGASVFVGGFNNCMLSGKAVVDKVLSDQKQQKGEQA